ncbi:MAG TPA: hypothetical protein VF269_08925 [Rhodanobacteraceae bacterium]
MRYARRSYRIEGDRFEFIAADPGLPRPRKFKTGPGQTLRRFVRAKPPA